MEYGEHLRKLRGILDELNECIEKRRSVMKIVTLLLQSQQRLEYGLQELESVSSHVKELISQVNSKRAELERRYEDKDMPINFEDVKKLECKITLWKDLLDIIESKLEEERRKGDEPPITIEEKHQPSLEISFLGESYVQCGKLPFAMGRLTVDRDKKDHRIAIWQLPMDVTVPDEAFENPSKFLTLLYVFNKKGREEYMSRMSRIHFIFKILDNGCKLYDVAKNATVLKCDGKETTLPGKRSWKSIEMLRSLEIIEIGSEKLEKPIIASMVSEDDEGETERRKDSTFS